MHHPLENDFSTMSRSSGWYAGRDFIAPEVERVEVGLSDEQCRQAIMELIDVWWGAESPSIRSDHEEAAQLIVYLDRLIGWPIGGAGDARMRDAALAIRLEVLRADHAELAAGVDRLERHANQTLARVA